MGGSRIPSDDDPHPPAPPPDRARARSAARPSAWLAAAATLAVLLVVVPSLPAASAAGAALRPSAPVALLNATYVLGDGASLVVSGATRHATLTDQISYGVSSATQRSYTVSVQTTVALPRVPIRIESAPVVDWSGPGELPSGPAFLPPISWWHWSVNRGTVNDSANWTWSPTQGLTRAWSCVNATFAVTGRVTLHLGVDLEPWVANRTRATGAATMLINPAPGSGAVPANDSDFASLLQPLHPALIRIGQATAAPATWNATSGHPSFHMSGLVRQANLTRQVGAQLYLSLPAGSWGDGNTLPAGMPLNRSAAVLFGNRSGYFPNESAYATYVRVLAKQVLADGIDVTYWNVGNEVPVKNGGSVPAAYLKLFDIAAYQLHALNRSWRVGSDVMTVASEIDFFAAHARGVDFLSFHFYPADVQCPVWGTYCAPNDAAHWYTDTALWQANHSMLGAHFLPPAAAQTEWHNVSGRWLPILDSESNLAKTPGGAGTDPRQQALFGAAWTASMLITGSEQNLSDLVYFALESPPTVPTNASGRYGGWGYGLTSEGTRDNNTRFAPYWTLALWGASFAPGIPGLTAVATNSTLLESYAARSGASASVILVNRADVMTSVHVRYPGTGSANVEVSTLDQRSYREVYSPTTQRTTLKASGLLVKNVTSSSGLYVRLSGYGVAVLRIPNVNFSAATLRAVGARPAPLGGPRLLPLAPCAASPVVPGAGSLAVGAPAVTPAALLVARSPPAVAGGGSRGVAARRPG